MKEYVTPEKFEFWKDYGESVGFRYVASGPLVSKLNIVNFSRSKKQCYCQNSSLLSIGIKLFYRLDHLIELVNSSSKA